MSIVAALDQVLFFNTTSKYTVMRLKTADIMIPDEARRPSHKRDHLIRFVAVGYDLPQTSAISMELDGSWEKGKYGLQFQVEQWREVIPPTIEGIRGYLQSGLLKGIGEKTAEAIVQRFGVQSLSILENEPDRLLEIRGITPERLEEIKSGYTESKMLRDLMTVLAPFKVTPSTAMRIYEHFGPGGVKLIQRSPFRLCQVPGFGFRRVDAIVQKSGGDLHDPMRIQGALFYALEQARSEGGHLYLEAEKMIRDTLQLLNEKIPYPDQQLKQPQVAQELQTMILSDVVVSNNGNIYLPHVFKQESETARKALKMVLQVPCCYDGPDLDGMTALTGLSREEIIAIHSGVDYKIYMMGFLPGFVYLGGLDKRICVPRLETPRTRIEPGSVGIGGSQTGVYPVASPGGWRILGRTYLKFYDPNRTEPILCRAGQYIRFVPISREAYEEGARKEGLL